MAMCLEDEDERIRDLTKLFFHELSKKGEEHSSIGPAQVFDDLSRKRAENIGSSSILIFASKVDGPPVWLLRSSASPQQQSCCGLGVQEFCWRKIPLPVQSASSLIESCALDHSGCGLEIVGLAWPTTSPSPFRSRATISTYIQLFALRP